MSNEVDPKPDDMVLALVMAFFPSVMLLFFFGAARNGASGSSLGGMLTMACMISVICCFGSAFMLFRRQTGIAIFAGIVFLVLNAVISFFFGCGAMLSGMNF